MNKKILHSMGLSFGIFIATCVYTWLSGYGFNTIEGFIFAYFFPALLFGILSFYLFNEKDMKTKKYSIFLGVASGLTIFFIEISWRILDSFFY